MRVHQSPARRACIVGVGETPFRKRGGWRASEFQLACSSILSAAADAGIDVADIDGICSYADEAVFAGLLRHALGLKRLRFSALGWHTGGGGTGSALSLAAAAVESGRSEFVAVFRSLCQSPESRYGQHSAARPYASLNAPFGVFAPAPMVAMVMRRHMHLYNTEPRHLGLVATAMRGHAQRNPRAIMFGRPMDLQSYFASRAIADPLRLYDCCLETDGACAVLVTTLDRARDLRQHPVTILAATAGSESGWGVGPFGGHDMSDLVYASANARTLARELFAAAGLRPADIDVAQLYDAFTPMVLLSLEDYGFCGIGESGGFVEAGSINWSTGVLPVNTAGGLLSEAYVHGLNLVTEAVRQLRHTSTAQVSGAETCLVTGAAMEALTSAAILARH